MVLRRVAIVAMAVVGSAMLPTPAIAADVAGSDHPYWAGTGSGGSIRCAWSDFTLSRNFSNGARGVTTTQARKDLFCVNEHDLPAGFIYAHGVLRKWTPSGYAVVDEYASYNGGTAYFAQAAATCTSCNDHSIKLQSAYQVNSLGGLHANLTESDPVPPT